jgi:aspartyl-tRNA(Asn)/glutamyl-tRNA(Gln) amidotransferase subunit A
MSNSRIIRCDKVIQHFRACRGFYAILPKEFFSEGLDDGVASATMAAVKEFEALGVSVKEISLPNSKYAIPTYYIVAPTLAL